MPDRDRGGSGATAEPLRGRSTARPKAGPADPRKHAAQLLKQADSLMRLARELRREAGRLNASLGLPEPQRARKDGRAPRKRVPAPRRLARTSEQSDNGGAPTQRDSDQPRISDGARLMITNMATQGRSREEILRIMRDELGLEDADAILESLSL
jgi:hypothetical protein